MRLRELCPVDYSATPLLLSQLSSSPIRASTHVVPLLYLHRAVDTSSSSKRAEWIAAARQEHARALQMLLDAGASLKAADSDGNNAVMLAIKAGSPHAVELLIAENALRHRCTGHLCG